MGMREQGDQLIGGKWPHWIAVTCAAVMFCHGAKTRLRPVEVLSFWLNTDPKTARGLIRDAFREGYLDGDFLQGSLKTSETGRRAVYANYGHKYANGLMMIDFLYNVTPRAQGVQNAGSISAS